MEILKPVNRDGRTYFRLMVIKHEPGKKARTESIRFRPLTPQQEAMTPEDVMAVMAAFVEENRW